MYKKRKTENSRPFNYITFKPTQRGIFSEQVFGPLKNWLCQCNKKSSLNSIICSICFVEYTDSRVRRYRTGYIDLNYPIINFLYSNSSPNYLLYFLKIFNMKLTLLDIYKITFLTYDIVHENLTYKMNTICGNEIIKLNLDQLNLSTESLYLRFDLYNKKKLSTFVIKEKLKILRICESFIQTKTQCTWILFENFPIAPPTFRPIILKNLQKHYKKNKTITLDPLNHLYTGILILNKYILSSIEEFYTLLLNNILARCYLQELINSLLYYSTNNLENTSEKKILLKIEQSFDIIDLTKLDTYIKLNSLSKKKFILHDTIEKNIQNMDIKCTFFNKLNTLYFKALGGIIQKKKNKKKKIVKNYYQLKQPIKCFFDIFIGKKGFLKQHLLGKRVNFSGRAVITPDPFLKLNQCGLPYDIVLSFLFFHLKLILGINSKKLKQYIRQKSIYLWIISNFKIKQFFVLLNRAPTLHRINVQSFLPKLVLDNLIHINPFICPSFNADFDGDQMSVYLPLLESSQFEIKKLMQPFSNIFSFKTGQPIIKTIQDSVLGCFYLTLFFSNKFNQFIYFNNFYNILLAWYLGKLTIHTRIFFKCTSLKLFMTIKHSYKNKLIIKTFKNIVIKNKTLQLLFLFNEKIWIKHVLRYKYLKNYYYIYNNLGFYSCIQKLNKKYQIKNIFLETTPGRLIFTLSIINLNKII